MVGGRVACVPPPLRCGDRGDVVANLDRANDARVVISSFFSAVPFVSALLVPSMTLHTVQCHGRNPQGGIKPYPGKRRQDHETSHRLGRRGPRQHHLPVRAMFTGPCAPPSFPSLQLGLVGSVAVPFAFALPRLLILSLPGFVARAASSGKWG